MSKTIAMENNLKNFKDYLISQGCQVVDMNELGKKPVDAIIISGADENLMNMQDIVYDIPVIDATGKSPEDVLNDIMN